MFYSLYSFDKLIRVLIHNQKPNSWDKAMSLLIDKKFTLSLSLPVRSVIPSKDIFNNTQTKKEPVFSTQILGVL